jgi:hypothetical protein
LPPAALRTRTRGPTTDALLAATHGVGFGSTAFHAATPQSRPNPTLAVVFPLLVRAASRMPSHTRSRSPALGRVANTAAAPASPRPTPAAASPRRPPPPVLRPSSPATQGVPSGCPVLSGRPGVVGLAAGEVVPRRHLFPGHFVKHLGPLLKTRVGDSARVATCRCSHNVSVGTRCG